MRVGRVLSPVVFTAVSCVVLVAAPAVAEPPDAALVLGSAAATAAGDAAYGALADGVERAGAAVGGAAAVVRPAGKVRTPSASAPASTSASIPATTTATGSGRVWTWNGWVSGASGPEMLDGRFGAFRGEPLGLIGAWSDRSESSQTEMTNAVASAAFSGEMDVAVGALAAGETWEQAAAGKFVTRWTSAVRTLRSLRAGKGTTYIRIAHEMNGDWMVWGMNSKNLQAYKKGYRLYASIVRKEFPQARLTWSPNGGNHTDVSIDDMWPGSDVVDVIGPDIYDFVPSSTTAATWEKETNAWQSPGSPSGLDAWRQYAARRGKPIAMPEWGLAAGDDPEWIRQVHAVMAKHAATKGSRNVAGKFVYDCYFNAESKFKLLGGPNTKAAAAYAELKWGR